SISQTLYDGGAIAESRRVDWSNAGLLKEVNAYRIIDVTTKPGNILEKVQAAMDDARSTSANGVSIVYFPAGSYSFAFYSSTTNPFHLTYPDSNIIFQGAGSDVTTLNFYTQYLSDNWNSFQIIGSAGGWQNLDQNINKGSTTIHGDLDGIGEGDWIIFCERYFDYKPDEDYDLAEDIIGQTTKLISKNTSHTEGVIKDAASKNYTTVRDGVSTDFSVRKVYPIKNIGIENLTIRRYPYDIATENVENIKFSYAVNCWVKGVEIDNTPRNQLNISNSTHMEVSGCYIHHAESYGGGGHGYGVVLGGNTTNVLVENNIFKKLRHAMIAGGGSNCCVWTFNYSREQCYDGILITNRDLDFHAKYPYAHLMEHNYIKMIASDSAHGENGPYNTLVRNYLRDDTGGAPRMIILETMDYFNLLGNMGIKSGGTLTASQVELRDSNNGYDVWSYLPTPGIPGVSHNWIYWHDGITQDGFLWDISYYYSSPPDFLGDISWPAIGPKYYSDFSSVSQNIPARDRYFNSSIKTYNPYPTTTITTSGTLSEDETWRGVVNITGTITIPSGVTLTILPGTVVRFNGYYSIYVTGGTLIANGAIFTAQDPGQKWNKLFFTTSNTSTLENCVLSYGNIALFISNVDIQMKNCTISNSNLGVYIFGSSASPTIDGCDIQDNDCAMYLTYGDPIIKNNKFNSIDESYSVRIYKGKGKFTNNTFKSRDGDCVYILGSTSIPNFEGETNGLGNYFTDCYDTYLEITGGNPELGFNTSGRAGYNLFEKDNFGGHAVNNQTGNSLYAQLNWWTTLSSQGGYPSSGSYFYGWETIYNPVCDKPNQVGALWKANSDPVKEEFFAAFNLYNQKQYEAASDSLERVFNKYPDHELAPQALFRLSSANTITDKSYE
nr:right-handed parallel beta-helix repeat-containing protein [candidate division KSB1 bacterium]